MNTPGQASAIIQLLQSTLEDIHTLMPAAISSYSGHTDRLARVQPGLSFRDGKGATFQFPEIQGVPVLFPGTSRFQFLYDLKAGDMGLLFFSEAAIGNWLDGDGNVKVPEDGSRFSLQDGFFMPGLFPTNLVPDPVGSNTGVVLDYEGNQIQLKKDSIEINDSNGNTIVTDPTSIILNGNLRVLQ